MRDPVADCADTAAAWHASWLTALGLRSERRDSVWRALDPPPRIYWTAITLAPEVPASALAEARGTVCDSWSSLDLAAFGFEERVREPWFLRLPGELAVVPDPPELEIVHIRSTAEVAEFEDISIRGFGSIVFGQSVSDPPKVEPGRPPSVIRPRRSADDNADGPGRWCGRQRRDELRNGQCSRHLRGHDDRVRTRARLRLRADPPR